MPNDDVPPGKVFLFSGHMIDAPGRKEPRFPPDKEDIAKAEIEATLTREGAKGGDLAICGGACGGDLIFAESCMARNMRLELYIPFDDAKFLRESVDFADQDPDSRLSARSWHDRFMAAKSSATLHVMPVELGPLPSDQNPYERNNLWMLEAAARFGPEKVVFICLWNGQGGDGPGGAQHFMDEAGRKQAKVHWLDTRKLWD